MRAAAAAAGNRPSVVKYKHYYGRNRRSTTAICIGAFVNGIVKTIKTLSVNIIIRRIRMSSTRTAYVCPVYRITIVSVCWSKRSKYAERQLSIALTTYANLLFWYSSTPWA